jgi:hypothetical protein
MGVVAALASTVACGGEATLSGANASVPQSNFSPPPSSTIPSATPSAHDNTGTASAPTTGGRTEPLALVLRDQPVQMRQRALLVTEIQGLENLFAQTPRLSADRRTVLHRLAFDYEELEAVALREKATLEDDEQNAARKRPLSAGGRRAQAAQLGQMADAARSRAVDRYTVLVRDYPDDANLDHVLLSLGRQLQLGSDDAGAREAYKKLLSLRSDSPLAPNARLGLAEIAYADAARGRVQWALVAKAYDDVIDAATDRDDVGTYAKYKLAWVYRTQGDREHAVESFREAIADATAHLERPTAEKIATAARSDLIDYAPEAVVDESAN